MKVLLRAIVTLSAVAMLMVASVIPASAALAPTHPPSHVHKCQWYHIPRWALEDMAWADITGGTVISVAGYGADGTIVGLPEGLVLNAIGATETLGGSWVLWDVGTYYPNGVWEYLCT